MRGTPAIGKRNGQRCGEKIKVGRGGGGFEHTRIEETSSVNRSGVCSPGEILKSRTPEMPFLAFSALSLEFILIAMIRLPHI